MKIKTSQLLSWGVTVFAALCGLTAFCMIFVVAIKTSYFLQDSFTGLQVALGASINNHVVFKASAGIILGFVFPLIAACTAVIGKGYKIPTIAAAAFMVTGGALALSTVNLLNPAVYLYVTPTLAAGPIAAGVLSLVGGVTLCGSLFLKE